MTSGAGALLPGATEGRPVSSDGLPVVSSVAAWQAVGPSQGLRVAGRKSVLNRLELGRRELTRCHGTALDGRRSVRCLAICLWRRTGTRDSRSSSISTPPTIRCMGTRKGVSFTAIATAIAICRCTFSAAGICWRQSCAATTSTGGRCGPGGRATRHSDPRPLARGTRFERRNGIDIRSEIWHVPLTIRSLVEGGGLVGQES
jgi:hypothetical protein